MYPTVLRMNATPVYRFLCPIVSRLSDGETVRGRSILDCGCGGAVPLLAIVCLGDGLEIPPLPRGGVRGPS